MIEFQNVRFEVIRTVSDSIIDSTIQLFYDNSKGEEKVTGSGVLFEIEKRHFVFTAAHVVAENIEDIYFLVPFQAIYLGGKLYNVSLPASGKRIDDKIDLAIIELEPEIVSKLKTEYKFQTVDDILLGHQMDRCIRYLSVGYPSTKTQKEWNAPIIKSEPFVFNSNPVINFEYERFGFNFESHLAIEFLGEVISEKSLQRKSAPILKGISGSGMWYLPNFPEIDEVQTKKLIGISIEQVNKPSNQAIVVTRIDIITEFLRQQLKIQSLPISKNIKINIR
jgi:hypothetical protein